MQLANNPIRQTHYNILNVKEDATHEEIRSSYRSALLTSHPDKLQNTSISNHRDLGSQFLHIQTAWEILGDVKSRALYDQELRVSRHDELTADEVELEDLAVETSGDGDGDGDVVELFYQCRCGDYFSLDSLELREMGFEILIKEGEKILLRAHDGASVTSILLPCTSCSLKIRLVINKDISYTFPLICCELMAGVLETLTVPRASGFPAASLTPIASSPVCQLSLRRSFVPESRGLKLNIRSFRSSGSLRLRSKSGRRGGGIVCEAQETAVQVLPVTDNTWQSLVLESKLPVLVEFWAPWCGPCRMIHPVIDELAKEYTGKLSCYKVNTDESPSVATKYGIRSIPTVMIFKEGEKKDAVIGAVPKTTLSACIEKFL